MVFTGMFTDLTTDITGLLTEFIPEALVPVAGLGLVVYILIKLIKRLKGVI